MPTPASLAPRQIRPAARPYGGRPRSLLVAVIGLVGCFSGDATIGSVCAEARDCGPQQQCRHEQCGRCGNGAHEPAELCYADPVVIEGVTGIKSFRVGDLDADGRDEIVTLDDTGAMVHGAPRGGGFDWVPIAGPVGVTSFAFGDTAGDGDGDIVAAAGTRVAVLAAGDDGGFGPTLELDVGVVVAEVTVVSRFERAATLAIVDELGSLYVVELIADAVPRHVDVGTQVHLGPAVYFDEDDELDLAIVDERQNRMGVVRGPAWDAFTRVDVGRGPVAVLAYDRDRDGQADFLTLDRFGRTVTLISASSAGELSMLDSLAFDTVPLAATAFDADFDGFADILIGTSAGVEFWRGEAGRYPEGVRFDDTGVEAIRVGRFGAAPVYDVVTLADGRLRRQGVNP